MTWEQVVIGLIRIAGSLPVLRWPFFGALVAILVDFSDLFLMNLVRLGGLGDYQSFDKWIDLVYMATFLIVALRWSGLARNVAIVLFAYRLIGDAVFQLTQVRWTLLIFPNVFEFWFVFVAGRDHFRPRYELTARRAAAWLAILTILKEAQEYILHFNRFLDQYNAIEVVVSIWRFFTPW